MRRTETPKPIWIKFCLVVDITDVVTYTNFGDHRLRGFWVVGDQILFSALTLLVGWQKGHPVKSRLVLPFWYRLTRVVSEKGPLDGCVCMSLCFSTFLSIDESVLFCCLRFPYQAVRLLGETSPKWPAVLCRVGCKTATQSVTG